MPGGGSWIAASHPLESHGTRLPTPLHALGTVQRKALGFAPSAEAPEGTRNRFSLPSTGWPELDMNRAPRGYPGLRISSHGADGRSFERAETMLTLRDPLNMSHGPEVAQTVNNPPPEYIFLSIRINTPDLQVKHAGRR
jgi:hypothetical protein